MLQMCVRQIVRKLDYGFVQEGDLKKAGSKKKLFQMKVWKRFKVECRMVKDKTRLFSKRKIGYYITNIFS